MSEDFYTHCNSLEVHVHRVSYKGEGPYPTLLQRPLQRPIFPLHMSLNVMQESLEKNK